MISWKAVDYWSFMFFWVSVRAHPIEQHRGACEEALRFFSKTPALVRTVDNFFLANSIGLSFSSLEGDTHGI